MVVELKGKDYIWSYIGVFVSLCSSILMTPFVIYFLDGETYGLWMVFQSIAAVTVLFDFGFSTTFARNINYCWNGASQLKKNTVAFAEDREPNFPLMKKTMRACRLVFLLISGTAFLIMITVGTAYIRYISRDMAGWDPIVAWLICAIAIFLNLYFGYYGSFLRGVGAVADSNRSVVIAKASQILVTLILLACGFGIIGTSVAYLTYGTVFRQLAKARFYRYKGIRQGLDSVTEKILPSEVKETFLIVWHNAWREGLVSLSNYLSNSACTVICSLYLPLTQTGAYALGVHLALAVVNISAAMYTANQPVLQSAYINNNKEKTRRTMSLIVFSFSFLYILGIVAVIVVGLPILRIIRPETVVPADVMLIIGVYQFIMKFRNCYTSYFSCTNRIPYVIPFLISSCLCVVFILVALKYLQAGIWGMVIAQIFSQVIFNAWFWPVWAHREMGLSAKDTVKYGYEEFKTVVLGILKSRRKSKA